MKGNKLLLFLLSAILAGCSLADVSPDYLGKYTFAYTIKTTKNGSIVENDDSVGFVEVTKGSNSKTVKINNFTDSKGNVIDFKVKLGVYKFSENYDKQGCKCKSTVEGKFDSGASMTYRQELIVNCGNDEITALVEGRGIK